MTVGQMSEILVLFLIPMVAKVMSRKLLLALGLVAYAARMALFAYVDVLPLPATFTLLSGVALHGLCFGCFIFVAFMVVDEETSTDVRASAQSLFNLVIIGIGIIVGSKLAGEAASLATSWSTDAAGEVVSSLDYSLLFSYPMWASVACLAFLMIFYPARSPRRGDAAA